MNTSIKTGLAAAAFAMVGLGGCHSDQSNQAAQQAGDQTSQQASSKMDQIADKTQASTERAGDAIADAAITTKVKAAILGESGLKVTDINVATADGIVTLAGTVDSEDNRQKAELVAGRIDGVKSVTNNLTVKQG